MRATIRIKFKTKIMRTLNLKLVFLASLGLLMLSSFKVLAHPPSITTWNNNNAPIFAPGMSIYGSSTNSPGAEQVPNSIDNNVGTKFLDFDKLNVFFVVNTNSSSVANTISLTTANDAEERDPANYELYGSNNGTNFTLITTNSVVHNSNRHYTTTYHFSNSVAYQYYKVLFPTVYNPSVANSVQIAEVQLYNFTSGWSNGTPNASMTAIINGDYNTATNGNITAGNITVNAGYTLNLGAGTSVSATGAINNNGTIINCGNQGTLSTVTGNPVVGATTSNSSLSIGQSNLPFTWNGLTFNAAGTQTAHITNNNGCDSAATLVLSVGTPINWTGAVSTDWNDVNNWSGGDPNNNQYNLPLYIPSNLINEPLISDYNYVGINFDCVNDGTITLGNQSTLQISGNFSGTGLIVGNNTFSPGSQGTTISINNNTTYQNGGLTPIDVSLRFDQSTPGGNAIGTLQVNDNVNLNILNHLEVISMLGLYNYNSFGNGPLVQNINTNNNLTLKSSLDNTASVDQLSNVTGANNNNNNVININGNVTVERYVPKGLRSYRDINAGGISGANFFNSWQESGATIAGYGLYITGKVGSATGIDASTGLDITATGNPSLYSYTNGVWAAITHTKSNAIDPYKGYRALVRGDRNIANFGFSADPVSMTNTTVIRTSGNLIMGDVNFTTNGVTNDNTLTNGQFNSGYSLQTGQDAFNLVANPYASVVDWTQIVPNVNGNNSSNSANIYNSYWYFDPTFFNNGYATYVTYNSITGSSNPSGSNINQYIQPGQSFFIQNNSTADPILSFTESNKVGYWANANNNGIFGSIPNPNRLHISLRKNIGGNNSNIDGAVVAFNNNFTKAISFEDSKKMNNSGENISILEGAIDLSIDGLPTPDVNDIIAIKLTQLVPNTTYELKIDANMFTTKGVEVFIKDNLMNTILPATEGISFIPTKDALTYQGRFSVVFKAAKVNPVFVKGTISIYPNPVTNSKFNLQMSNMEKGTYTVNVINNLGQVVLNSTISNESGESLKTIASKGLTTGVYTVQVIGKSGSYNTELIVK